MCSTVCRCVLFIACAFVGLSTAGSVQDNDSASRALLSQRLQPFQTRTPSERELMNRLLSRILDMTYDMYEEMGASQQELKDLHHKRGIIQTCYFQAVSCY